jgi:hypothetical protein
MTKIANSRSFLQRFEVKRPVYRYDTVAVEKRVFKADLASFLFGTPLGFSYLE